MGRVTISWSDGGPEDEVVSFEEAEAIVTWRYPEAIFGPWEASAEQRRGRRCERLKIWSGEGSTGRLGSGQPLAELVRVIE